MAGWLEEAGENKLRIIDAFEPGFMTVIAEPLRRVAHPWRLKKSTG